LVTENKKVVSGTVTSEPKESPDRRRLFRRLIAVAAGLGVSGLLLGQEKARLLPSVQACSTIGECISVTSGGALSAITTDPLGATGVFANSISTSNRKPGGFARRYRR
jgi:hypothetical protein